MSRIQRRGTGRSLSGLLLIFKPRCAILLMLLAYHVSNEASGEHVHAKVNDEGELRLHSPNGVLERIDVQSSGIAQLEEEVPAVGPFIGNPVMVQPRSDTRIRKRDCDMPSIATRGLIGTSLKRSFLATTHEEMEEKKRQEERQQHWIKKRNAESGDGILPWTCETKYEWKDMGTDHYPRFVRTAECKSKFCVRGFYRCKPRRYKTKILKRNTGLEASSCEDDDVSLPETLRSTWKFITVTINLCCDCTGPGRVPGTDD